MSDTPYWEEVLSSIKLRVLVYGKPGTYKTRFANTFPTPYFFDFDKGLLSLRDNPPEADFYPDKLRNGLLVETGYLSARQRLNKIVQQGKTKFETIVIDSISTMQQSCVREMCNQRKTDKPTLQIWGDVIGELSSLFIMLQAMPCHVVVTAHELMVQDEWEGRLIMQPLIVGTKLPGQFPLYFDEVYHSSCTVGADGSPAFSLRTARGVNCVAKSRLGCLPLDCPPSFQEIMKHVHASTPPPPPSEEEKGAQQEEKQQEVSKVPLSSDGE